MRAILKHQQSWWFVPALAIILVLEIVGARRTKAAEYAAATSGTWSHAAIWTPSGVPGSGDTVVIGGAYLAGSAGTATVTLGSDQSVAQLYLGSYYGSRPGIGALNLAGHQLTLATQLVLGAGGGSGTIVHNGGSFSTPTLDLYTANSLVLAAGDTVSGSLGLYGSSTLTLGAPMNLSGNLDLEQSSTLNMAGNALFAYQVEIGWQDAQPVTVLNRGPIAATYLDVAAQAFNLGASDSVTNCTLSSGTTTTAVAGNITDSMSLGSSSELTLGAPLTLSGNLDVEQNSTLNMAGKAVVAPAVYLGWDDGQPITVLGRGPITATNLDVAAQTFNLSASDSVTNFNLSSGTTTLSSSLPSLSLSQSSQATTATTGNVTDSVNLDLSSTLSLGAPMRLSGNLDLERSSTLNMANQPLQAQTVWIGWQDGQPVTVLNRGPITAVNLYADQTCDLGASDNVTNFNLSNGTSTLSSSVASLNLSSSAQAVTTASGGASGTVSLYGNSTLTLGAPMRLSGNLDVEQGSTLDMGNHPLSAQTVYLGWYYYAYGQSVTVLNRGPITAGNLAVGGQAFDLSASDNVTNFNLSNGTSTLSSSVSNLSLSSSAQAVTTAAGNVADSVSLDLSSTLTLGAPLRLSGNLDLERSSALNMAGQPLTAQTVWIGWEEGQPVTVLNHGTITAANLYVLAQTFNLGASDNVTNFTLSTGTSTLSSSVSSLSLSSSSGATTTASGSVTDSVSVYGSSVLTLGAPMRLGSSLDLEQGSTLDMGNHPLWAQTVYLGWYYYEYGQPVAVLNPAAITATNLQVGGQAFNLIASDNVTNFSLSAGTSTLSSPVATLGLSYSSQALTTTAGNVTDSVTLDLSSTLSLGASLRLSGDLDVERYSTLNMAGYPLYANYVYIGWEEGQPVTVLNRGPITTNNLLVGGQTFNLSASDSVTNLTLSTGTGTLSSPVSVLSLSYSSQATTTGSGGVTDDVYDYSQQHADHGGAAAAQRQPRRRRVFDAGHGRPFVLGPNGLY